MVSLARGRAQKIPVETERRSQVAVLCGKVLAASASLHVATKCACQWAQGEMLINMGSTKEIMPCLKQSLARGANFLGQTNEWLSGCQAVTWSVSHTRHSSTETRPRLATQYV